MKQSILAALVGILLAIPATAAVAQDKPNKAKEDAAAWLAPHGEPATINVHGIWNAKDWGTIVLSHFPNSREVTGLGDQWEILGTVSGNRVYLVFYAWSENWGNRIGYSAILTPQGDDTLVGTYNSGLKDEASGKAITLKRAARPSGGMDPGKWVDYLPPVPPDSAFVLVYRNNNAVYRKHNPMVYVDETELANIGNNTYFIVKVAPGSHTFRSTDSEKSPVTLDCKAGQKYYLRAEAKGVFRAGGWLTLMPADQGDRELHALQPLDAGRIVDKKNVLVPSFDRSGT